ncbi:SRPBCC family protein [Formosa sp. A9]|uniref:SRPBCC family protein n=1 Tax=Formosa sp. A9 TaxID=3442641 RepID=UPI003EBCD049
MTSLSWQSFTKKIFIKASLEQLFWCWTTEAGITAWFLKDAKFLRADSKLSPSSTIKKGDSYVWQWHNWDGKEEGRILDVQNNTSVSFSFAGSCEVTVSLEQHDTAILVTLTQTKIPNDDKSKLEIFYGCSNGWTFWLANLKAYLEHGIVLNETEIDLRPYPLSGFEFVNM